MNEANQNKPIVYSRITIRKHERHRLPRRVGKQTAPSATPTLFMSTKASDYCFGDATPPQGKLMIKAKNQAEYLIYVGMECEFGAKILIARVPCVSFIGSLLNDASVSALIAMI